MRRDVSVRANGQARGLKPVPDTYCERSQQNAVSPLAFIALLLFVNNITNMTQSLRKLRARIFQKISLKYLFIVLTN